MSVNTIIAAVAIAFAGATPALAAEPTPPAGIATAAQPVDAGSTGVAAAEDTQRYCIVEQRTGSRVPQKVCKTKRGWANQGLNLDVAH